VTHYINYIHVCNNQCIYSQTCRNGHLLIKVTFVLSRCILLYISIRYSGHLFNHTCQVTRFRRVTPGNRACHPHFPEHPSGHGIHYDDPESPGIGQDIRNIYLFGKYRDFTYQKDNNPNGQLQSTTIYL
jgi:hypothetical protein